MNKANRWKAWLVVSVLWLGVGIAYLVAGNLLVAIIAVILAVAFGALGGGLRATAHGRSRN